MALDRDLTPLDDFDQPLPPLASSRVSGGNTGHVAFNLKSTLVSAEVMARYLLAKEKIMEVMKLITNGT